jgi:hypothetical protein
MQADEGKVETNVGPFFQVKPILSDGQIYWHGYELSFELEYTYS